MRHKRGYGKVTLELKWASKWEEPAPTKRLDRITKL